MSAPSRVIAVGDVHGCAAPFAQLLEAIRLTPGDTLVMLGDAIDRGPDSRGVIERLLELRRECKLVCILGNHEQMLLDSLARKMPQQEWLGFGGAAMLDSYGLGATLAAVPKQHVKFIRSWGDYYETESHFFAHGNYYDDIPLKKQPWHEMRWVSLDQYAPGPHQSGKTAVVGHTSNKRGEIANLGHLVCIDTFCHGGGWLTAYDVASGRVWQTNNDGALRETEMPPVQKNVQRG